MSEIDCIGRIESFWPKFGGGKYFRMFSYNYICVPRHGSHYISLIYAYMS